MQAINSSADITTPRLVYFGGDNFKDIGELETAISASDWQAVISWCCGGVHNSTRLMWSAAMSARYGAQTIHLSRCNADGTPTQETLEKYPDIARGIEEAIYRIKECYLWQIQKSAQKVPA